MTEILKDKLSILYRLISAYTDKQKEVLNIVENFFGKDNVDCQIPDYNFHNYLSPRIRENLSSDNSNGYIALTSRSEIKISRLGSSSLT